jgi:hypothetical protein
MFSLRFSTSVTPRESVSELLLPLRTETIGTVIESLQYGFAWREADPRRKPFVVPAEGKLEACKGGCHGPVEAHDDDV